MVVLPRVNLFVASYHKMVMDGMLVNITPDSGADPPRQAAKLVDIPTSNPLNKVLSSNDGEVLVA